MSQHQEIQEHDAEEARELIEALGLIPHPEGGYYKETFRAPTTDADQRGASTAIYFLLARGQTSHWHKVDAVESWLWHSGAPLELRMSHSGKVLDEVHILGPQIKEKQVPQAIVPKDSWQSAKTLGGWTLVSCIVAPGFQFSGFELAPNGWEPGHPL